MKNMLKDAAILLLITLTAGLALGFVYQITKEPIALAEERAAKEAYAEVFSQAADFKETELFWPEDDEWQSAWAGAGLEAVELDKLLEALDADQTLLGYHLYHGYHVRGNLERYFHFRYFRDSRAWYEGGERLKAAVC